MFVQGAVKEDVNGYDCGHNVRLGSGEVWIRGWEYDQGCGCSIAVVDLSLFEGWSLVFTSANKNKNKTRTQLRRKRAAVERDP